MWIRKQTSLQTSSMQIRERFWLDNESQEIPVNDHEKIYQLNCFRLLLSS